MSDTQTIFEDEASIAEFKSLMSDPASRAAFVELKARAAENGARLKYAHVMRAVSETPWAIRLPMLGVIVDLLAFRVAGGHLSAEEIDARIGAARRQQTIGPTGVAVLPIHGVIMPKASMMSEMSGGTSIDSLRQQFRQAIASKEVAGIVFDVDSPGGMVDGVPEMAAEIRAARGSKPIVAIANTEAASAAYWLASQADEVIVSKSGRVGSIGVYTSHEDESSRMDQEGLKTTLISAGKYKTEGNPFEPLTEEARASLQSMVDDYYGMFVSDVAKGRRISTDQVRTGYGEGRVVQARPALASGMVDKIATLDDVLAEMLTSIQRRAAAAALDQFPGMVVLDPALSTGSANSAGSSTNVTLTNQTKDEPKEDDEPALDLHEMGRKLAEDSQYYAEHRKAASAVDDSPWDAERAMAECELPSQYSSISAAEQTIGTPEESQHWALPHHYVGHGPNVEAVRDALSRLSQAQNISDVERTRAQQHLDAHMREINPDPQAAAKEAVDLFLSDVDPDGERLRVREHSTKPMADVDHSEWDVNKALNGCVTEEDFHSVCAGHRETGAADEREHWVLAHHYLNKPANIEGVRNALARMPHIESIANRDDAERHLNYHLRQISPSGNGMSADADVLAELQRVKSSEDDD